MELVVTGRRRRSRSAAARAGSGGASSVYGGVQAMYPGSGEGPPYSREVDNVPRLGHASTTLDVFVELERHIWTGMVFYS